MQEPDNPSPDDMPGARRASQAGTARAPASATVPGRVVPWEAADGEGPDRLFNRYRRLRLQALAGTAA